MSVLSKVALTALGAITSGVVAYKFMYLNVNYAVRKVALDSIISHEKKQCTVKTIQNFDKDKLDTRIKYQYVVPTASFKVLQDAYSESLYGNPITKNVIDTILTEYINNTPNKEIKERYVLIDFTHYSALIEIKENIKNNDCLKFYIYADVNVIIKSDTCIRNDRYNDAIDRILK